MKICHRHPEPVSKNVIRDGSREVLDQVVGHVIRAAVGVDVVLLVKERSDLGVDTQLFAQFTAETIFKRFIILELAAGKLPLERVPRRLPALTQEHTVRSGCRSVLNNDADCYLDHKEKIMKLAWKYNEPRCFALNPTRKLRFEIVAWTFAALLRTFILHSGTTNGTRSQFKS